VDVPVVILGVVLVVLAAAAYVGVRSRRPAPRGNADRTRDAGDRAPRGGGPVSVARGDPPGRSDGAALTPQRRERYAEQWLEVQRRFVDDPAATLGDADRLITQVLRERGLSTDDEPPPGRAHTLAEYREAHAIAERHERGGAPTDELRRAMQRYRAVFEDVVEPDDPGSP
jgi:hypothetical protein